MSRPVVNIEGTRYVVDFDGRTIRTRAEIVESIALLNTQKDAYLAQYDNLKEKLVELRESF